MFVAEQLKPVKRRVALKVIRTGMPSKQILARFEAERQALAMMDHQNIAKVLDAGITDDGRPYFAMELVKGIPITDYCDQNKLTPEERLQLFVQACRAIQHAHQKGIIHRDIKPSNVMATLYDGRPTTKVIDFGLAKALHDHAKLTERTLYTQHGQIVGTLEYMSPEQAERSGLDVDTRTDVFSLGVILYELMTGSTPIGRERLKSETMDRILVAIREEDAPRMSTRLSQSGESINDISDRRKTEPRRLTQLLKGDLQWVAARALEKDRTRRYDGAGELADDVQRYLNNEPIEARPPSLTYRLQKAYRRHKLGFITAATILGLLIAGLIGTGTMWLRASAAETDAIAARNEERDARIEVESERDKASAERDRAQAAEEQALQTGKTLEATLARSNYTLAVARWDAGRPGEALEYLDRIPAQHRDFAWRSGHTGNVRDVCFTQDGTLVVSGGADGTIRTWSMDSGSELRTIKAHTALITSVAISSDESFMISSAGNERIKVWAAPFDTECRVFKGHTEGVVATAITEDEKYAASAGNDKTVRIWELETGKCLRVLKGHTSWVHSLAFSEDGAVLGSGLNKEKLYWDTATGKQKSDPPKIRLSFRTEPISPRWRVLPDGNGVLVVDRRFKSTPREATFRRLKSQPDKSFYKYFADESLETSDWFGGAVHNAWQLLDDPNQRSVFSRLHLAHSRLSPDERRFLPDFVQKAVKLPAPAMTRAEAVRTNNSIWSLIETRRRKPPRATVNKIQEVCDKFPEALFLNTLGVARFRTNDYEKAIEACERAIAIDSTTPINFAIIAMSHAKLDRPEPAAQFRKQFAAVVEKLGPRINKELQRYVDEVKRTFEKK